MYIHLYAYILTCLRTLLLFLKLYNNNTQYNIKSKIIYGILEYIYTISVLNLNIIRHTI